MAKFEQKYSENHENNATATYPVISVLAVYNLYLVLCFVSLFVCPMSDLNKNTPLTDLPEMLIGELVKTTGVGLYRESFVSRQSWVPKLYSRVYFVTLLQ